MPNNTPCSPPQRLLFAAIALVAGNSAMLLLLFPHARDLFELYAIFAVVGWLLVGVPFVLAFPGRVFAHLPWPTYPLIGAAMGPLALLLIFAALFALQGRIREFSLAHTESFWPLSMIVSTVSFVVYAGLLRWRLSRRGPVGE